MAYQVLARKWRPQRFDQVVGQQAVTRTLQNALASGRLAHAFVFAGPRGVGKTTTARILARALNCVQGPTREPCGACDACVEIAEGRDMDVLEIDAATHTGIDNVREVIISGLGIMPVRDRYKIFIIDEVHQLSASSFNALLKSIEEPPPHVVFMMATTALDKIPDTVRSRSQVHELRALGTRTIADQLGRISAEEGLTIAGESLQLIARDAEGSMRDAQSKLDQVIAFTGRTISAEDVAAVLGLVGRDLLLDVVQAVADEDAQAAFSLSGRAVELGYDLRRVCTDLSRVVRDLLVLSVDPSRAEDAEIAAESERERLLALARLFSREDLLRAFDVLARAEVDIRAAAEPRHHLEMALLRWIYLRKLVPLEDLIASAGTARISSRAEASNLAGRQAESGVASRLPVPPQLRPSSMPAPQSSPSPDARSGQRPPGRGDDTGKDLLLAEIRRSKVVFYNTVVAQAQKIEVTADRVVFSFSALQRTLRDMFEQNRTWLEGVAEQAMKRKVAVVSEQISGGTTAPAAEEQARPSDRQAALREQALADASVQALLEVFPADIRDVEEI